MSKIDNDWLPVLQEEFGKPYYKDLYRFVRKAYAAEVVCPDSEDIFNAYHFTPLNKVKVVILGDQPYAEIGQADGLAYSSKACDKLPPKLYNIFKELNEDIGCYIPDNGCLHKWANQGVLLLNNVLTVRAGAPGSHKHKGWEKLTEATLRVLNDQDRPIVFLLWGKEAMSKSQLLTNKSHLVLKAPNPSPLSAYRGFFGCRHFSKTNEFLIQNGLDAIDWQIENREI